MRPAREDGVGRDGIVSDTVAAFLRQAKGNRDVAMHSHSDTESSYRVLSYLLDFGYLWTLDEHRDGVLRYILTRDQRDTTLVLIWDGCPTWSGSINLPAYLTPYDWIVAFSCKLVQVIRNRALNSNRTIELPRTRVLMFDMQSQRFGDGFGPNAYKAIRSALPWFETYAPIEQYFLGAASLPRQPEDAESWARLRVFMPPGTFGAEEFITSVFSPSTVSSLGAAQEEWNFLPTLEVLAQLWTSNLLSPAHRHHVANLLAPIYLCRGLPRNLQDSLMTSFTSPLLPALEALIGAIGLVPASGRGQAKLPSTGILGNSSVPGFLPTSPPHFLMIDDQFSLGYHELMASVLAGTRYNPKYTSTTPTGWTFAMPGGASLECQDSPNTLLTILEASAPVVDWSVPRLLHISFDVLILDLRLWTEEDERRIFMDRLVRLVDRIGALSLATQDENLHSALNAATSLARGEPANEVLASCLLPMLVSHLDPSIPIVLFSSTQQRMIRDVLKRRLNVITDFTKPLVGDHGGLAQPSQYIDDLKAAVQAAIRLRHTRKLWQRIVTIEAVADQCFEVDDSSGLRLCFNPVSILSRPTPKQWNRAGRPVVNAGARPFPLDATACKRLLSRLYVDYIVRERYFDFLSIPWEFLEATLGEAGENFDTPCNATCPARNHIARAIKWCRHRKAHGFTDAAALGGAMRDEQFKACAVFLFLLLLDYLTSPSSIASGAANQLSPQVETAVIHARPHLGARVDYRSLISDTHLDMDQFCALIFARMLDKASAAIHIDTVTALKAWILQLPMWIDAGDQRGTVRAHRSIQTRHRHYTIAPGVPSPKPGASVRFTATWDRGSLTWHATDLE